MLILYKMSIQYISYYLNIMQIYIVILYDNY